MTEIEKILIERDGISKEEASDLVSQAKLQLAEYLDNDDHESAEQICEEFFGLDPDYIFDLL